MHPSIQGDWDREGVLLLPAPPISPSPRSTWRSCQMRCSTAMRGRSSTETSNRKTCFWASGASSKLQTLAGLSMLHPCGEDTPGKNLLSLLRRYLYLLSFRKVRYLLFYYWGQMLDHIHQGLFCCHLPIKVLQCSLKLTPMLDATATPCPSDPMPPFLQEAHYVWHTGLPAS